MSDLIALLESRHETMLQWCEPWPACGPEGNDLYAEVILQATVHDCINMQRRVAKAAGRPTMGDDGNFLLEFMAIHWTRVVKVNNPPCAVCGGKGWFADGPTDHPVQIQCQHCQTNPLKP